MNPTLCPDCLEVLLEDGDRLWCSDCGREFGATGLPETPEITMSRFVSKAGLAEVLRLQDGPAKPWLPNEVPVDIDPPAVRVIDGPGSFEGTITKVEWRDSKYGRTARATVRSPLRTPAGKPIRVWGTVPKDIIAELLNAVPPSTDFERYVVKELVGLPIRIVDATFSRQDDDFAFFNRGRFILLPTTKEGA